jgi:hypothetical protein
MLDDSTIARGREVPNRRDIPGNNINFMKIKIKINKTIKLKIESEFQSQFHACLNLFSFSIYLFSGRRFLNTYSIEIGIEY